MLETFKLFMYRSEKHYFVNNNYIMLFLTFADLLHLIKSKLYALVISVSLVTSSAAQFWEQTRNEVQQCA